MLGCVQLSRYLVSPCDSTSYFEVADSRSPIKRARRIIIFVRIPESGIVYRINTQSAIISPPIAGALLTATAIEKMTLSLRQSI
jgi:hypothetical protein